MVSSLNTVAVNLGLKRRLPHLKFEHSTLAVHVLQHTTPRDQSLPRNFCKQDVWSQD